MLSKANYRKLKDEFGLYASWGIWDNMDINVCPTDDDFSKFNNKYMFVGLNASRALDGRIWGNFHCKHRGGRDKNIMLALQGTEYEGSYMTDILKDYAEPNGTKARKYFEEHPEEQEPHFHKFLREVELLGKVNTIFVFGGDAFYFVKKIADRLEGINLVQLTHYSSPTMYRKGAYTEYFKEIVGE